MATEASNILAEGTLYANLKVAGVYTGWKKWPGLNGFKFKPNSELKEQTTKDKGQYGQIVASVAVIKPADLTIEINQVAGTLLAAALQGSVADLSEGSGTVTDETVTAIKGGYIKLAKRNIAATGFVVTNSAGTTTYAAGTDYTINYVTGMLFIPTGSTIVDAAQLKVDYTHNAVSGQRVKAGTVPQVIGKFFLDGKNLVDGRHMTVMVHEANLTADSEFDPMSDNFVSLALKGRAITPEGLDSPLELDINLDFAA